MQLELPQKGALGCAEKIPGALHEHCEDGDVFGAVRRQEGRTAGQEWAPFQQLLFCLSVTWPAQAEMSQC